MEELKNEPNTLKQIGYAIKDSGIFQSIYAKKNNSRSSDSRSSKKTASTT